MPCNCASLSVVQQNRASFVSFSLQSWHTHINWQNSVCTWRHGGHVGGVNKETAAILEEWNILLGIEFCFMQIPPFVSLCKYGFWSHERTHSINSRVDWILRSRACYHILERTNTQQTVQVPFSEFDFGGAFLQIYSQRKWKSAVVFILCKFSPLCAAYQFFLDNRRWVFHFFFQRNKHRCFQNVACLTRGRADKIL